MADCALAFPATFEAYAHASAELRAAIDRRALQPGPRYKVELVFEEIVSNIIRHGCVDNTGCTIELSIGFGDGSIVLEFQDNGRAFDPRDYAVSDVPLTLEDARHGGLGLLLVRKASAGIDYERTAGDLNRLTVTIAV